LINGEANYISPLAGALTPVVSDDTLIYNINDFGSVDFNSDFNIKVQTHTTAISGDQICFMVIADPVIGDLNPGNNFFPYCFTVVNSYDPNDKQVYPSGGVTNYDDLLSYTIRFQNTGTAPAQQIYILDTLDSDLDVSTFVLTAYSHENFTQILENGIVKFNFPDINLPDSTSNEPASHGYVQYRIKLKVNLSVGTQIQNTASIYFDFNTPVVTNTILNTLTEPKYDVIEEMTSEIELMLYPNPATTQLNIQSPNQPISTIIIHDLLGREIFSKEFNSAQCQLNIAHWNSGVYLVKIKTEEGEVVKKMVKN